jgi:hypothetical protein
VLRQASRITPGVHANSVPKRRADPSSSAPAGVNVQRPCQGGTIVPTEINNKATNSLRPVNGSGMFSPSKIAGRSEPLQSDSEAINGRDEAAVCSTVAVVLKRNGVVTSSPRFKA